MLGCCYILDIAFLTHLHAGLKRGYLKVNLIISHTRDVFYVRREVDLLKTAKVNAYIMHIFGKLEL